MTWTLPPMHLLFLMKMYSGLLLSPHAHKYECLSLLSKAMTSNHLSLGPLRLLGWFCSGRMAMKRCAFISLAV